ncbi:MULTISPECIES: helix-turn-helix transcriptional regulator [unclassified Serratia (in: enterobacteria)]|uniref:helix-turn-helix transcriptional regulator n=1 Tax=unclassified Serratia (in: enterobacteria) TaxID=2647522 RepID=UPI003075F27E
MEKKKLLLHCPCHFIQMGLEEIFSQEPFTEQTEIVASVSTLKQCEYVLFKQPVLEMVILTLDNHCFNPVSLLNLLTQCLPGLHPNSKIVLIGDIIHMKMLKRYLGELNHPYIFLDISLPVFIMQQQLHSALQVCLPPAKVQNNRVPGASQLSSREKMVLNRVLNGETIAIIATDLRLHYKTVNHYKRSALLKLGVYSLPMLLMQDYNRKMVGHILGHLSKKHHEKAIPS